MTRRHFEIVLFRRRRLGKGVISPGTGGALWDGYNPSATGVSVLFAPGVGAATWAGFDPFLSTNKFFAPGVGAATYTGYTPTISGLISPNALNWGSTTNDYLAWGSGASAEITWGA